MIETAMVFDNNGDVIYWHEPPGRSGAHIPDSRSLWDVLWENRRILGGVAHTHPWGGVAWPSESDVTTFSAIERGLGRRFVWPIVTLSEVKYFAFIERTGQYHDSWPHPRIDIAELRRRSRENQQTLGGE